MGEFRICSTSLPPEAEHPDGSSASRTRANGGAKVLFFGKAPVRNLHVPPYYTDTSCTTSTERFFKEITINGARPPRTDRSRRFLFAASRPAALFARRSVADTG